MVEFFITVKYAHNKEQWEVAKYLKNAVVVPRKGEEFDLDGIDAVVTKVLHRFNTIDEHTVEVICRLEKHHTFTEEQLLDKLCERGWE